MNAYDSMASVFQELTSVPRFPAFNPGVICDLFTLVLIAEYNAAYAKEKAAGKVISFPAPVTELWRTL